MLRRDDPQYRDTIIAYALKLFHNKGIKEITMSQIAEDLHISKRTLYEIYQSKERLVLGCLKQKQEQNRLQMEDAVKESANVLEGILRVFRLKLNESHHISPVFVAQLQDYPAARKYFAEQHERQRQEAVAFLVRGIEEGVFLPETDFEIVYDMTAMMVENVFALHLIENHTMAHVFSNTILRYIRGCSTEKGIAIIDAWISNNKTF